MSPNAVSIIPLHWQIYHDKCMKIDLKNDLVDLSFYRLADRMTSGRTDPIVVFAAYAQDKLIYKDGRMTEASAPVYQQYKLSMPSELVNKFGLAYADNAPLLLHKRLADVFVDVALDLHSTHQYVSVVMDGLRTYDCAITLQESRPDLVAIGLLTHAGKSAHNRALAVDSKLFIRDGKVPHMESLLEVDEHGHLDDLNMQTNSRFYTGPMSSSARHNRLIRLQAWQRASVKNRLPIASLLSEFWDDRVTGSPADMWRVLSCRLLCAEMNGSPEFNPIIANLKTVLNALHANESLSRSVFAEHAHAAFVKTWYQCFDKEQCKKLDAILGNGGGEPPALDDFMFHEWLDNIYDADLVEAGFPRQTRV
jgi:hypothetical protein